LHVMCSEILRFKPEHLGGAYGKVKTVVQHHRFYT